MEQKIKNIFTDFAIQMEMDVKYDNYSDTDIINKWTAKLLSLNNEYLKESKALSLKELYADTVVAVLNKTENNILFDAIPTGLSALDRVIGGLPTGELIIVGARPAMGKTGLLITIMANSIKNKNEPIGFFTLENSAQYIMLRLLSVFSRFSHYALVSRPLGAEECDSFIERTKTIEEANITIEDNCFTIDDIVSRTYFLVKEKGVKLIIIDYLQLIQTKGKMNREQEVSKVCRELKALARKYNIAVFVSSQLSRSVETRGGDKRPQLADLRESGAIEQDADKVLFLHRPEYYNITEDECGQDTRGIAEIIIAKNRGGVVDSAKVRFVGQFAAYEDIDMLETNSLTYPGNLFKNIRKNEFDDKPTPKPPGSKANDIEEDHPF